MRLHRLVQQSISRAVALAAMACILLALAATAGAVPTENVGPENSASRAVATPTVVKETVVRPSDGTDAIVFVLIGVGTVVAMLGAGYLGARIATRTTRVRPTSFRTS
jgi:phage-related minor tail protein